MNTDIKTRIEALRPPPTPPRTPATAAAMPAPDDSKNLLPMFIDLVAELFVTIKDMQRIAADTESAVKRFQQEVPAACRQVVREEVLFLRAQTTEQHRVPPRDAPPIQQAATDKDHSVWILIGVGAAAVAAGMIIQRLC